MFRIYAELDPSESIADPQHKIGLTNEGYEKLVDVLGRLGFYDIEIEYAEHGDFTRN